MAKSINGYYVYLQVKGGQRTYSVMRKSCQVLFLINYVLTSMFKETTKKKKKIKKQLGSTNYFRRATQK